MILRAFRALIALLSIMADAVFSLLRAVAYSPVYLVREALQFLVTVVRYYPNARFRRADLLCLWTYLLRDPYKICQHYLRDFPNERVQKIYGETFFITLETIATAINLSERDVIYDLGCGRGRSIFWFNAMYRCRAVGVEINPVFVAQARKIQKRLGIDGVDFLLADLMEVDYDDATVLYLYGTAFNNNAIARLIDRFATLRKGTRIVCVSYPLTRYTDASLFELEQTIKGKFLWGDTDIYIHRKL